MNVKMKHLLESIGIGLFVGLMIFMGFAIAGATITIAQKVGGKYGIIGVIIIISSIIGGVYHYQNYSK